jgi:hypothetical protein
MSDPQTFDERLAQQMVQVRQLEQPLSFDFTVEQVLSAFGRDPKEERDRG